MISQKPADVLVLGAGPAALSIASELIKQGLNVKALASHPPDKPWENTYGIWAKELESLDMASLLGHRWTNTVSFFGNGSDLKGQTPIEHKLDYGLFDKRAFQDYLLKKCKGINWIVETVQDIAFERELTEVVCVSGVKYFARIVIDASGHRTPFIKRPSSGPIAEQVAYGIVGRFSIPPVGLNQFVLMDFRPDHLSESELKEPPSFLYAMDLGEGVYFIEETSLASSPPLSFECLKERLYLRLANRGIDVEEIYEEEHCLFPMNLPLPVIDQPLLAFGGAASMVHPASGYMVGALLRRAPELAKELARSIAIYPPLDSAALAKKSWNTLWPLELIYRHRLYQYGLSRLMSFNESNLRSFFSTFFKLPREDWFGFLANTLSLPKLLVVMLRLFFIAPIKIKLGMVGISKR